MRSKKTPPPAGLGGSMVRMVYGSTGNIGHLREFVGGGCCISMTDLCHGPKTAACSPVTFAPPKNVYVLTSMPRTLRAPNTMFGKMKSWRMIRVWV